MMHFSGPHIPCENPRALVVLLHGYGSDGENMLSLADSFQRPDVFFWCPQGHSPCETHPGGRQWFSLSQWDSCDFEKSLSHMIARMDHASELLIAQLHEGIQGFEGPIYVGGFSQGAALAYHIGLFGMPTSGVMGFSGFYHLTSAPLFRPPLFWSHGKRDEVVPFSWMEKGVTSLKAYDLDLTSHVDPDAGHHITPQSTRAAGSFLQEQ
jgi:phospholipase/carboxylesterase